jgi:hypothetical protein
MIRLIFAMLFLWSSLCASAAYAIAEARLTMQATSSTPIPKRIPPKTSTAGDQQLSPESEIKKLQGGWQVIKWDESGQPPTAEEMKELHFVLKGR